jgi:exosome complex component RRP41
MEVSRMGGSKVGAPEKLIINGKRLDGRTPTEFRPIKLEVGPLMRANGSGMFRFGNTHAIAAVYGPKPFHPRALQDPQRAILRCKYTMAPFSTGERTRPGNSRRSTEISKVITDAFQNVVFTEEFPRTGIDVFIEIVQADASTRIAGVNAAAIALADAGVPMRDLITSVSVGRADKTLLLDVGGLEDNFGDVDMAVATVGGIDKFVLLQMDGIITREEFETLLNMAKDGCAEIYKRIHTALRNKYENVEIANNRGMEE